ncbi:MAG: flagellar basal body-associated FliL family protein [Hydrogenophaga sp.]|uniref:flagellar basal body-associated FliL family protein n=1 Tax=Hydrogenophaga sp. TaxID=1904254 RepID=UPI00261EFCF9|nr:flagellar basal body-associated FliL family protein [Hydrogenophaga sp.]MCV0439274.1 flagellar basal body-associated FliL family protein [Hydrogenophaga sp.]
MSAAAAATAPAAAPEAPRKKSRKLLFILIGVVLLAVLGAAAALFILKSNTAHLDDEGYEDEDTVASQSSEPRTPPVFLPLENMVINLADPGGNRFIQLGLTLQLQDTATETAVKAYLPSIRSNILVLISQRTADEMLQLAGKEKLARDIIGTISKEMGYQVQTEAEAEPAEGKKKKKAKSAPNPVQAVLFSSLIVQ